MKNLIASVLLVASIVLAYLCYLSIMAPIKFDQERKVRETAVISRLVDIRKIQEQHLAEFKSYIGNVDSLAIYAKQARVARVIKEGEISDADLEKGMTEAKAIKLGLIIRDTVYQNFLDSTLKPSYDIDSIAYVPIPEANGAKFEMAATEIPTVSNVPMPVFEAKTPYDVYLNGMDHQTIVNLKDEATEWEKYAGLKIGDLKIANNNAGNWE